MACGSKIERGFYHVTALTLPLYHHTYATDNICEPQHFQRWLYFIRNDGTKHLKVYCNGEMTILPRHPSKELKQPLVECVKKKLKLK